MSAGGGGGGGSYSCQCNIVCLKCNSSDFVKDDDVFRSMLTEHINVGKHIRSLLCHLLGGVVCAFVFARH